MTDALTLRAPSGSRPVVPTAPTGLTRRRPTYLASLAGLALVLRMAYDLVALRGYQPRSDAFQYDQLARAVAGGQGLALRFPFDTLHPTAFRPPLWPLLLGAGTAVTGAPVIAGAVLNLLLGVVVVVLVAVLAHRLGGPTAGVVAGGIAAAYPPLVMAGGPPLSEPLGLALILAALLATIARRPVWAGLALGALLLTRPGAEGFVLLSAGWLAWRVGWRQALATVALVAATVAPWLVRNAVEVGAPVLTTSQGFNLAAMYSPKSVALGSFIDPVLDAQTRASWQGRYADEASLDAYLRSTALTELRAHPEAVLAVAARNVLPLLDYDWGRADRPERLDGRWLPLRHAGLPMVWVVTAAGAVGLVLGARAGRGGGLVALAAAYVPAVALVTVAAPRLRAPYDVLACVGVGLLVARLLAARRARGVAAAG